MEKTPEVAKKFTFEKNEDGLSRRLTVESDIKINQADLSSIQEVVRKEFPEMKLTVPGDLHFTWAHYGRPDELYEEVLGQNPELNRAEFDNALQTLLTQTSSVMAEEVDASVGEINLLGRGAIVLGVELENVMEVRTGIYGAVLDFLRAVGVEDPDGYVRQTTYHSNLHNTLPERSKPHITIGRIEENNEENLMRLRNLFLPTKGVRLKVTPSRTRNASIT